MDDDMAVLLAELDTLRANGLGEALFFDRLEQARENANRESDNADRQQRRAMAAEAQVQRAEALATNWERLAATAMDEDVREWCTAAAKSVRDALAPVAPDAEPGGAS